MITIETDVLVIGTGGAGCRAALEAKKYVNKVIMLAKGPLSKSELTIMTMPGFDACLPGDPQENVDNFFYDTMKGGSFINEENLAKILTEKSAEAVMFLESLGARFDRNENGDIYRAIGESEKYTSLIKLRLDDNMGRTFYNALSGEISRKGIYLQEDVFVTSLIYDDKEVSGAFAINIRTGDIIAFYAKATVLATGGASGLYSVRTSHPRDTGDGYAIAYRIGADLIDMEFIQSNPAALVYPNSVKGIVTPGWYLFMDKGVRYLNSNGEAFLEKYDPERKEMTTRDIKARAMHTEIVEGRGSKNRGVYLDFSGVKLDTSLEDYLKKNSPFMMDYVRKCGLPPDQVLEKPIEIGPAAHFTVGGIKINERAETTREGLFAAGEVTGGIHGANRLAGNAMTDIFVFGRIAGESAGRYAKNKSAPNPKRYATLVDIEHKQLNRIFNPSKRSYRPSKIRNKIEELMFEYVGFGRDEAGLLHAVEMLDKIKQNDLSQLFSSATSKRFNYEMIQILELHNMIEVAKMITLSALYRKETRGCQNRIDYPQQDDLNWKKHTLVRKKENQDIEVSSCPQIIVSK